MSLSVQYDYIYASGVVEKIHVDALNDILCLYYGTRCVFSHGLAKEEGALKDYPPAANLAKGMCQLV